MTMKKLMNIKTLALVFGGLLVVYLSINLNKDQHTGTFDKQLVALDTSQVDRVVLKYPELASEVELSRNSGTWNISKVNYSGKADGQAIGRLIAALSEVEAERVVTRQVEKYSKFQVTDSAGKRAQIYSGGELLADLVVGKFNYDQKTGKATSYVKLNDDERVFGVEGMLSMTVGSNANSFRSKTVVKANPADLSSVEITWPDSMIVLSKLGGVWQPNAAADSAQIASYIQKLGNVTHYQFNDDVQLEGLPKHASLKLGGDNMSGIEVEIFQKDSAQFIVTSSQNPATQFESNHFLIDKLLKL